MEKWRKSKINEETGKMQKEYKKTKTMRISVFASRCKRFFWQKRYILKTEQMRMEQQKKVDIPYLENCEKQTGLDKFRVG